VELRAARALHAETDVTESVALSVSGAATLILLALMAHFRLF
jgi:hypothetical protein